MDPSDSARASFQVFLSYRRSDTAGHARALHRELSRRFDEGFVFFDRAGIDIGDDFPERLRTAVEGSKVVLVAIGPGWLDATAADGSRRLDDPKDFVRSEVAMAFDRGKVVLPVLFDDVAVPQADRLPQPLQGLARRDMFVLRGKAYEYERQLEDLVKQLALRTGVAPHRDSIGVAIDVGDDVAVYRHVEYLPVRLRAPLRDAFRPLLEDRQRWFGGRRGVIDRLMGFIGGTDPGYCVVTAPAGFGKTAPAASLVAGSGGGIAFHFFTPLHGAETLSESFFLKSVLEQMAAWHGEVWDLPSTLDELRAAYQRAMDSPLTGVGVLVLDGLDEVRDWDLAPYLSRTLPTGMRIIVTVRDVGQDWRAQYRFPLSQLEHIQLGGLDRAGVLAVLTAVGGLIGASDGDRSLVDAVFSLAGGDDAAARGADPFYLRFLAEDLDAGRLTAATIGTAPPGLEAYLDEWWREIRALAGDAPVRDLFGMLTVAAGPLERTELEVLQPSLVDEWLADRFDEVLAKVRRVVVRDADGCYSLIHPRLREFMQRRIRVEAYRDRLLAHCLRWEEGWRYALSYVGLHLGEAGDWPALRALVATEAGGRAFLARRYAVEGSRAGFLRDLERLWMHAEGALVAERGALADVLRCALVASSLRSMAGRLVPGLIAAAVREGLWTVPAAMEHAGEMSDPVARASAFGALLPWLSEGQRHRACESIVVAVQSMRPDARRPPIIVVLGPAPPVSDLDRRGDALKPLAAVMPEQLVDSVLPIVRSLDRPDQIPILLAALASALPAARRPPIVEEAFAAVERIKSRSLVYKPMAVPPPVRKARSLVAMSVYLDEPLRTDACRMAVAKAAQAPRERAMRALAELLPKLPAGVATEAVDRILDGFDQARSIPLDVLVTVAGYPGARARHDEVLAGLRSVIESDEEDAEAVAKATIALLPVASATADATSTDLIEAAFATTASVDDEVERGRLFWLIAERTAGVRRADALKAAAEAAMQISDDEEWVDTVLRLAPLAEADLRRRWLRAAAQRDTEEQVRLLDGMAPLLDKAGVVEALALGETIGDGLRADALPRVDDAEVEWKPDEDDPEDDFPDPYAVTRPNTLQQARAIIFDLERVAGLVEVAATLEAAQRQDVLEEAFGEALRINDRDRRQQALWIVGRRLVDAPPDRLAYLCVGALRKGASRSRFDLTSDLMALKPLIAALDPQVADEIPALVGEIGVWLP